MDALAYLAIYAAINAGLIITGAVVDVAVKKYNNRKINGFKSPQRERAVSPPPRSSDTGNPSTTPILSIEGAGIGLTDEQLQVLSAQLTKDPDIRFLNLNDNPNVTDIGAQALAIAIERHQCLTAVDVRNCSIGRAGITALINALRRNQSIMMLHLQGIDTRFYWRNDLKGNPGFSPAFADPLEGLLTDSIRTQRSDAVAYHFKLLLRANNVSQQLNVQARRDSAPGAIQARPVPSRPLPARPASPPVSPTVPQQRQVQGSGDQTQKALISDLRSAMRLRKPTVASDMSLQATPLCTPPRPVASPQDDQRKSISAEVLAIEEEVHRNEQERTRLAAEMKQFEEKRRQREHQKAEKETKERLLRERPPVSPPRPSVAVGDEEDAVEAVSLSGSRSIRCRRGNKVLIDDQQHQERERAQIEQAEVYLKQQYGSALPWLYSPLAQQAPQHAYPYHQEQQQQPPHLQQMQPPNYYAQFYHLPPPPPPVSPAPLYPPAMPYNHFYPGHYVPYYPPLVPTAPGYQYQHGTPSPVAWPQQQGAYAQVILQPPPLQVVEQAPTPALPKPQLQKAVLEFATPVSARPWAQIGENNDLHRSRTFKRAELPASKPGLAMDPDNLSKRAMTLTNEFRASAKLPPLNTDLQLHAIALAHSRAMADGKVSFGHANFNDRNQQYITLVAPRFVSSFAENVAFNKGFPDPAKSAVDGWIQSDGHRKNMLASHSQCAIAVAQAASGAIYFTQLFAQLED